MLFGSLLPIIVQPCVTCRLNCAKTNTSHTPTDYAALLRLGKEPPGRIDNLPVDLARISHTG